MKKSIKITRDLLFGINDVLFNMNGSYDSQLKYAIKRNKDLIKGEIDAINEAIKTNIDGFEKYEEKRMNKLRECIKTDKNGKPVKNPLNLNSVLLKKDKVEDYTHFMKLLNEEYKVEIAERNEELKNIDIFLNEEIEVEVYKINNDLIKNLANDDLNQKEYETIFPLIRIDE